MRNTIRQLLYSRPGTNNLKWLFANGEVGAWYDYRDLSTLFQTSTGTTAVTAGEQPVGLVLDKSKGAVLGPELVTNGGFDSTATGWTPGDAASGLSVVDGRLRVTNGDGTGAWGYTSITTVIGRTYKFNVDYTANTSTQYSIGIGTTPSGAQNFSATGLTANRSGYVTATATTTYLYVQNGGVTTGKSADYDNISVRELPGSHALQSSSTVRPTYRTGPDRLYFDADPDSLTITFPSAPGDCTVAMGNSGGDPVLAYPVNIPTTSFTLDPASVQTAGTELVTNGDFSAGTTGWKSALGTTQDDSYMSVTSGVARLTNTTAGSADIRFRPTTSISVTAGKTYKISISVVRAPSTGLRLSYNTTDASFNAAGDFQTNVTASGTYTYYFAATTSILTPIFRANAALAAGDYYEVDNISVRELIGSGVNNTGLVIVNRALTDSEKSRLTAYFKNKS